MKCFDANNVQIDCDFSTCCLKSAKTMCFDGKLVTKDVYCPKFYLYNGIVSCNDSAGKFIDCQLKDCKQPCNNYDVCSWDRKSVLSSQNVCDNQIYVSDGQKCVDPNSGHQISCTLEMCSVANCVAHKFSVCSSDYRRVVTPLEVCHCS